MRFVAEESRSHKAYGDLPFDVMMSFSRLPQDSERSAMILGYSGPATSRAIHLFDRPNYDLDSSFVTPVVVRSTSKYSLSIGYRAHSSLLDCARWPNSAINCVTNAPLSRAEVFTVLLIDYEAWVCDLNPRDINGLPGALSFILCGQTVFSLAVNPGQTGATGPCRRVQFLGATSLSVERQPMGTSLTCQPRRQQNRRKLLPTLGFELRRADIGQRDKEFDTEDLESLPHDLQGFQPAPHFAIRLARVIPGLDQINRTPVMRQHDATR